MEKRLFRQRHPVLFGLLILGVLFTVFWGGITFFILRSFAPHQTEFFRPGKGGIGIIELNGVLVSSEQTVRDLTAFREDEAVKAIIIRIDSPGGAVGASQEIYEEIKRTAREKPIVASMASVAASGGYYAALGANQIFANPGTLTGSIGVILKFANLKQILDKVGYKAEVIKSGTNKDIGSFSRDMTEEERALLQTLINSVHEQFVQAVSQSRSLPLESVTPIADGRIFTGKQALEQGLIDTLGNFTDAVEQAAKMAGLPQKELRLIYPKEDDFSFLKMLAGENAKNILDLHWSGTPAVMYEWSLSQ
nr:signal peptide peptidase SppA [Desulfobulbaceae bacterium]